ncbi:hypothetical protein GCM10011487_10440 [Steroidobacter agaridevorans]|uniref:Uncharacterized protein n=1 Tax=Steroidobacter agaridevorans TaxID=2695856 RepID=A0A829Y705_9GAMM|nr:hypothetical protein [Steroidobacter agaridevorans]GFE79044.1 hypothetical protein GCM10011487_10440 [Steroidobacter agaridevorans]
MDVRFSGQALYCQISRAELATLSSGRSVDLIVSLPRHRSFRVGVRSSAMSADRGGWQLESDPTGIWLTIPRAELEQLGQTEMFAERLMRDFPVSSNQQMRVILEAVPDAQPEDRSVIEITPPPDSSAP